MIEYPAALHLLVLIDLQLASDGGGHDGAAAVKLKNKDPSTTHKPS
jgi:hypothetical protein